MGTEPSGYVTVAMVLGALAVGSQAVIGWLVMQLVSAVKHGFNNSINTISLRTDKSERRIEELEKETKALQLAAVKAITEERMRSILKEEITTLQERLMLMVTSANNGK